MSDQQLHHLFNHLPSIGLGIALTVMLIGWILKKNASVLTGAWIMLVSAVAVFPANHTGEESEEKIEHLPGVNHDSIHEHEEAAESALPFTVAAGGLALIFIFASWRKWSWNKIAGMGAMIIAGVAIYFLIIASHAGGLIRHPELDGVSQSSASGENEEEDEH